MKTTKILKAFSLLLVLSLMSFTRVGTMENNKKINCELSVQSDVQYGVQRKMVDGIAFSKKNITADPLSKSAALSKGVMEICVGTEGNCKWSFTSDDSSLDNDVSVEVLGLEDIVKTLNLSSQHLPASTDSFIKISKSKGANEVDLGNGTISLRLENKEEQLTTITLIDTKQKTILGASVYDNQNTLKAKVICKYKNLNNVQKLHTMSLLVFEHALGEKTGWLTEVIACY